MPDATSPHAVKGYFNPHQRATVQAAMARIIPTDDSPGATEAGTVDFVDRYLSGIGYIYAKPDGTGFEELTGKQADAWRRRIEILRGVYTKGVEQLDTTARELHDQVFADLEPERQDEVLRRLEKPYAEQEADLEQARPTLYGAPVEPALQQTSAEVELGFVPLLALHTRQGFYSDPIYGGNRDRVGWNVIGFPGPTSLADVHNGSYSTLDYFADDREHPVGKDQS
jgi:gluconate 2-dehydrogenase gamma chain